MGLVPFCRLKNSYLLLDSMTNEFVELSENQFLKERLLDKNLLKYNTDFWGILETHDGFKVSLDRNSGISFRFKNCDFGVDWNNVNTDLDVIINNIVRKIVRFSDIQVVYSLPNMLNKYDKDDIIVSSLINDKVCLYDFGVPYLAYNINFDGLGEIIYCFTIEVNLFDVSSTRLSCIRLKHKP